MKSYERFAEDVLWRIQQKKRERRQRRKMMAAVCACTAIFALTVMANTVIDWNPAPISSSPDDNLWVYRSMVRSLSYNNGSIEDTVLSPVQAGHTVHFSITATDVSGYDADKAEQLRKAQQNEKEKEREVWMEEGYSVRASVRQLNNTLISYLATSGFTLQLAEWGEVESVTAASSSPYGEVEIGIYSQTLSDRALPYSFAAEDGVVHDTSKVVHGGFCWLHGQQVTLSGDMCRTIYEDVRNGVGSLTLTWKPGQELLRALAEDTAFALPDHIVSFTVGYKNGRSEVHTLTVHYADGQGYVRYDGVSLASQFPS